MSLLSVVFRMLSKDGLGFIEPRREDGHGSSAVTPTFVDTGLTTQTDALTDAELRAAPVPVADPSAFNLLNRTPPAAGAYGYSAGVSGAVIVAASRRVVMFTCVAGVSGATVTINGGDAIAVPANRPLTIEPRGNLVAPTIVFSGTVTYFVEHVL